MNKISIKFAECPKSNDHEACIIIDGNDWLGNDYMGMDPPRLFSQKSLLAGGKTIVGRCNCGCEGCDDVVIDITVSYDAVIWESNRGYKLEFNKDEYLTEITNKKQDCSWESVERTAERLVDAIFRGVKLSDGLLFNWSSARIKKRIMTLSFIGGSKQKVIEFLWNGIDPMDAKNKAVIELKRMINNKIAQQGDAPKSGR
jgi:hypothetical protein